MKNSDTASDVSAIYNACWWVRNYERGARLSSLAIYRNQAIQKLGLTCRDVFNRTPDDRFEPVLTALVDGLHPLDPPSPF